MSIVVLNGSPKKDMNKSGSEMFARSFVKGMKTPCEIKYIGKTDPHELAEQIKDFDTVIIVFPLYIHAMPGIVMRFFEEMQAVAGEGKSLGFIIQAGFPESSQEQFVLPYLGQLANDLGYNYLGTVIKGDAAAVGIYPQAFAKLLLQVMKLGEIFEETHAFDPDITEKLAEPYRLSKLQLFMIGIAERLGVTNIFWNNVLKKNSAFEKRYDKPYA